MRKFNLGLVKSLIVLIKNYLLSFILGSILASCWLKILQHFHLCYVNNSYLIKRSAWCTFLFACHFCIYTSIVLVCYFKLQVNAKVWHFEYPHPLQHIYRSFRKNIIVNCVIQTFSSTKIISSTADDCVVLIRLSLQTKNVLPTIWIKKN